MPHINVKLWPGRSKEQKDELVRRIIKDVTETLNCKESSVSVAIEEIPEDQWGREVYKPELLNKADLLYKRPGYTYEDSELE